MRIRKFAAPSFPEALAKVKESMGQNAVILKTRLNYGSPGQQVGSVEVTAAIDPAIASVPLLKPLADDAGPIINASQNRVKIEEAVSQPASAMQTPSEILAEIKNDLASLKIAVENSGSQSLFGQPSGIQIDIARKLVEKGIPELLAADLVKKLAASPIDKYGINEAWDVIEAGLISCLGPGEPVKTYDDKASIILLLGPTGCGKTSAAARLAYHHKVEKNIPVILISTDIFRADSMEQLKSLADAIGCPSLSISTPDQLHVALKSYRTGLIIIDTSGISNSREMGQLVPIIGAANPHEIHLVVPADMQSKDLTKIINAQPDIQIDKILVTKLDQSCCRGGIVGAAWENRIKFSYQCASRELPGRFGLFDPLSYVLALLPESSGKSENSDAIELVGL